uniref:Uncharacterized protein n=1 Tax=Rhizophora mucronata TaxID=61149 RepID=A0A2P2KT33_RHIMU
MRKPVRVDRKYTTQEPLIPMTNHYFPRKMDRKNGTQRRKKQ